MQPTGRLIPLKRKSSGMDQSFSWKNKYSIECGKSLRQFRRSYQGILDRSASSQRVVNAEHRINLYWGCWFSKMVDLNRQIRKKWIKIARRSLVRVKQGKIIVGWTIRAPLEVIVIKTSGVDLIDETFKSLNIISLVKQQSKIE